MSVMVWVKEKGMDTAQYMGQLCRWQQIILRGRQYVSTFLATFKNILSPMAIGGGNEYTLLWATDEEPKWDGQQILSVAEGGNK
jgi:hypothetical protein